MAFLLEVRAFDVLDQIHVQITSRNLAEQGSLGDGPIRIVQTAVQAPETADRRAWLQDALIAALEAL